MGKSSSGRKKKKKSTQWATPSSDSDNDDDDEDNYDYGDDAEENCYKSNSSCGRFNPVTHSKGFHTKNTCPPTYGGHSLLDARQTVLGENPRLSLSCGYENIETTPRHDVFNLNDTLCVSPSNVASMWIIFSVKSPVSRTRKTGILGSAINWLMSTSFCGYSHCEFVFILTSGQFLACSVPYGENVTFGPKHYDDGDCEWHEIKSTISGVENALNFCKDQVGKGFNSAGLYAAVIPIVSRWIPYDARGESWFCSELCMSILQSLGEGHYCDNYSYCKSSKICPRRLRGILIEASDHTLNV